MSGLIIILAIIFAINIGASGTAAAMSEAYGSGAVGKRLALILVAFFTLVGAVVAGGAVVETIGKGVVQESSITLEVISVVLLSAVVPLFLANFLRIPLSTSEVTVGALVGVGLAVGGLKVGTIGLIALSWVLLPILAFVLAVVLLRLLGLTMDRMRSKLRGRAFGRALALLLICGGCYTSFAAGANNTANSVGLLVGAGMLSSTTALVLGGLFLGVGAIALGGRVLETNGRRITRLSKPSGITVTLTSASLVLGMSLVGIPVPLTQATTGAIAGVGFARFGWQGVDFAVIRRVVSMWVLSPAVSLMLSFFLMNFLQGLQGDFTALVIVIIAGAALTLLAVLLRGRGAVSQVMHFPKWIAWVMGVHATPRVAKMAVSQSNGRYASHRDRESRLRT